VTLVCLIWYTRCGATVKTNRIHPLRSRIGFGRQRLPCGTDCQVKKIKPKKTNDRQTMLLATLRLEGSRAAVGDYLRLYQKNWNHTLVVKAAEEIPQHKRRFLPPPPCWLPERFLPIQNPEPSRVRASSQRCSQA
jgi:hypothetical protein